MPNKQLRAAATSILPTKQAGASLHDEWLLPDFLRPGDITLLTGHSHIGKSTLLAGLLRTCGGGGQFLGRNVRPSRGVLLCDELLEWGAGQITSMRLGPHVALVETPSGWAFSREEWNAMIDQMMDLHRRRPYALFAIDPINDIFPAGWQLDPCVLNDIVRDLRRIAAVGVAIMLVQRFEYGMSEEGILALVDIGIELRNHSYLTSDSQRRQLVPLKCTSNPAKHIGYEWDGADRFAVIDDPETMRFESAWKRLKSILQRSKEPLTADAIMKRWPSTAKRISPSGLQKWLKRASEEKRVKRLGRGHRRDPYRYCLEV